MDLWQQALKYLEQRLGRQNFETWIRPIQAKTEQSGRITLEVPNKFFRDWLVDHFLSTIQETLSTLAHQGVTVSVNVSRQLQRGSGLERRDDRPKHTPPLGLPA